MAYYCSEAVHDEEGRLGWEGLSLAGDQTGGEVITRQIRADGERWERVYRPINASHAYIIGESAYQCATNDHIGYDQSQRLTLYEAWKALPVAEKNIMNITTDVECDCSAMVAVCCINAGIDITPQMRTNIEDTVLMSTGLFQKLSYEQGMKLKKGDILWRNGHTGVCSQVDEEHTTLFIGKVKRLSGVYKTPVMSVRNHVPEHPLVGKDNMVDVLKVEHGKKHVFYLCNVAGVEGYILKSRIKKA